MSGSGERTEEAEEAVAPTVGPGQMLYTSEGRVVGVVRGIEEDGVFVSIREGVEALSVEHVRSGHDFGSAELMWRCNDCGEMGRIDGGLPDECPNCAAPKEELMYWTED